MVLYSFFSPKSRKFVMPDQNNLQKKRLRKAALSSLFFRMLYEAYALLIPVN